MGLDEQERVRPDVGRRTSSRGYGDVHRTGATCWADGSDLSRRDDGVARGVHGTKLHRRGAGEVGSEDRHRGAACGNALDSIAMWCAPSVFINALY